MKNKKVIRYTDRVNAEKIFLGLLWIVSGVLYCFHSTISSIISVLASAACIYTFFRIAVSKKEIEDEMAEQNMNKAKAFALDWTLILCCCVAIISILFLRNVDITLSLSEVIPAVVFVGMGINQFLVGIAFRKFDGE